MEQTRQSKLLRLRTRPGGCRVEKKQDSTFWHNVPYRGLMLKRIQRILQAIQSNWALAIQVLGVLSVSAVSAVLAAFTDFMNAYGPLSWWMAALMGGLLASGVLFLLSGFRLRAAQKEMVEEIQRRPPSVNPLQSEFRGQAITALDLRHPITHRIEDKEISDCDIIGPAVLMLVQKCSLIDVDFINCDFVRITTPREFPISTVTPMFRSSFYRCRIYNCTFFVPPPLLEMFENMKVGFVNPREGYENPQLTEIGPRRRR